MATEIQQVRAFISARKRGIEAAEKRYDIRTAVNELCELAAPLHSPERFSSLWKNLYLGPCYRDVVAFLVTYVAVHVEPCFTPQDRALALEVFFDSANVPSSKAIGALVSTLTAVSRKTEAKDSTTEEDREASIAMCVQLLEKVIHDGGIQNIVTELVLQEHESKMTENHNVIGLQVLISQLASLPGSVQTEAVDH
ncbi:hypothetical protein CCR75_006944 [Bremia lactucae]|uniref:Uncharacterized protein n=1 Tax=Bremia lactucae TaxID=4779 RepID=A0A976FPC1_BRELC|nr:hypothetical protein CCR75_006944 [Bremia lactucae]